MAITAFGTAQVCRFDWDDDRIGVLPPRGNHQTDPFNKGRRDLWHCAYCGQGNAAEREECRCCRAPRPEPTK